MSRKVICYMDKVDFDHEIGNAFSGNSLYPSIEALKEAKPCVEECGIVEVEVALRRVIQESNLFKRKS